MRTIFSKLVFLPCLFTLLSCQHEDESFSISETTEHEYDEVMDKEITWNEMFSIEQSQYLIYFYSTTCSHCKEIKNQIIEYALSNDNFFFIKYSDDVIIAPEVKSTIGATSPCDVAILGTPSLVEIENGVLINNLAGVKEIMNFLHFEE